MYTPAWQKTNAFRVLRIPAGASLSEVHKATTSMRRAILLDAVSTTEEDVRLLGEIPRTEADIRAAIDRLENPTQRIHDRLFWFHSLDAKASGCPSGFDASVWNHDLALREIFAAFETGFDDAGIWAYARALRSWQRGVSDDDYWVHILGLEQQGDFEPAAVLSEVDELRYKAVEFAAEPLVMAGRDAVVRGNAAAVRQILVTLEQLADTGLWVSAAQQYIASSAVESFRKVCREAHEDFSSKVVREQNAAKPNQSVCEAGLARFRADIEPELRKLILLLPPGYEGAQEAHEEAAFFLSSIAADFTWADDLITSEKLYEEALKLLLRKPGSDVKGGVKGSQ